MRWTNSEHMSRKLFSFNYEIIKLTDVQLDISMSEDRSHPNDLGFSGWAFLDMADRLQPVEDAMTEGASAVIGELAERYTVSG